MSRVSDLLERARRATSLENFGDDRFREGLEVLITAADTEAGLDDQRRAAFDAFIVDMLSWRLKVEQCYAEHPEIDEQEIVAPLIGLGLPRTGSTVFSYLLGEDPATRSIRTWEGMMPCPPPEAATQYSDPRIELANQAIEERNRQLSRWKAMMPSSATSPLECQTFMGYDFKSHIFVALLWVPSYAQWLLHKADLVPTYQYVKRVLKLLQWRCPPSRWRLKNPSNILFIDALNKVFPDARFWQTHRGVEHVIPSVSDLYYELIRAFSPNVDRTAIGVLNADTWELGMRRLIAFRDAGNDSRFFDIEFSAFQRDPMAGIRALYNFLGEPLSPVAVERMEAWRRDATRDKHGVHLYDAADFGLDVGKLRERFRFYNERFNLP